VPKPAIVFIGFMGAGKSTALSVAEKLGRETVEVDDLMEREFGMPIADAFERHGEAKFRAREAEIVGDLLEHADGGAIALGGGSVLSEHVRSALDRHVVIWLQVEAGEAWRRIEGTDRPLARSEADVRELLDVRLPLYEELADVIILQGDISQLHWAFGSMMLLAEEKAPPRTKMLWATSESDHYPVFVGRGLLRMSLYPFDHRVFCVTDTTVGPRYAKYLPADEVFEIEPGEQEKTLDNARKLWKEMVAFGLTRHDSLVALGGGVVGDLAGFCGATYQRGMDVVQVPTTLVAQVDSAYGGKTGVDLPEGKNYVGAYHMPKAVIADVETLASLPHEELAAGFVEALKTGLLVGGALWERVRAIESLNPAGLDDVVFACARYKCEVVAEDERDSGRREVLNLGHTVGHAIEAASGYGRYRHGEAIGLGLLAALRLSDATDLRDEVEEILRCHGLPVALDRSIEIDPIMEALERDKKRTSRGVGFVLLAGPGEPRTGQLVDPAKVEAAVEELYE
jgi:shikimate kinase / 3-dehydroquinate synthase